MKPRENGVHVIDNMNLETLVPYIDWTPFFYVWSIRGRYPNRTYPKIFNDALVGEQAKQLYDEA